MKKDRIKELIENAEDCCIHCHMCQDSCAFLRKYKIDIGDTDSLQELSYHCFLCGKCSEVCPQEIDGRNLILEMRREIVRKNGTKNLESTFSGLLKEKRDYKYKNYRKASGKSVLFPGCNFPSFYPKTTKYLENMFSEFGIGVIYDCCGKPVAELGLQDDEDRIVGRLNKEFADRGIEEIIMLCPNCYEFLNGRVDAKILSIYDKLRELHLGNKIEGKIIFPPCPDRESLEIFDGLSYFLEGKNDTIKDVTCCGLGGCARVKEPELAKSFSVKLKEEYPEGVYVYCGSCAGNLTRNRCKVTHVLPEILGTHEKPDIVFSKINRMRRGYIH